MEVRTIRRFSPDSLRNFSQWLPDTLCAVWDLRHTALIFQHPNACYHVGFGEMFNHLQQFGVFLAHDLVKLGRLHPGSLQLLEGLTRLDRLMLPNVTHE